MWENEVGKGIGHFFGTFDIEGFRDKTEFKKEIDAWVNTMRNTKPQPGADKVLIPGDPERMAYEKRMKEGIPVDKEVLRSLQLIAEETGIKLEV